MYSFLLCSYVPWNIHEPHPGQYNFDGDADLLSFIELINETGLLMVLRPGKYWLYKNSFLDTSQAYSIQCKNSLIKLLSMKLFQESCM